MADNDTSSAADDISDEQLVIIRVFTIVTAILGTTGNALTIIAIYRGGLHKVASFQFILNLSVCNFIHCLIFHPLLTIQSFHGIWTGSRTLCNIYSYGLFSNLGTELWGYILITLNRYFCVVQYHRYSSVYGQFKHIVIQIVVTWLFYPVLFIFPLTGVWGRFEYAPQKLVCHPFNGYNCKGFCLFTYVFALLTTAPLILFCYTSIIVRYVNSQRKIGLFREKSVKREPVSNGHKSSNESKRSSSELRMAFTIMAVILVFSFFRLPFMVLYLYDPSMRKVNPVTHTLLIFLGSSSNWINPVLYSFSNKLIVDAIKKMCSRWKQVLIIQQPLKS